MIDRIFPASIDNNYRGHKVALWLFVPIALQKLALALTHLLKFDGGAQSLSTIPLDTYPASATQNIIGLFARMGLEQLMLALILLLVLIRYRSMIPLMYVLLVTHYLASRLVSEVKPLALAGTSGVKAPLLVIAILSAIGLVLSMIGRGYQDRNTAK